MFWSVLIVGDELRSSLSGLFAVINLFDVRFRLFGPRKKMTNAIARWHSNARSSMNDLEQAYADRLEGEMQEMALQLHQVNKVPKQIN